MASMGRLRKDTQFSEKAQGMASRKGARNELWVDVQRRRMIAEEYLTYVGEAKEWIEACINEELPSIAQFEDSLRNGVYLAKLARFFEPNSVKKIFDENQEQTLSYRHSDNFNAFASACTRVKLPKIFFFELTDLYDRKNMPKVIYMIHALSLYLLKLGLAPKLMRKKYNFTDEELANMSAKLGDAVLPSFGDLNAQMEKEMGGKKNKTLGLINSYEEKGKALLRWMEEMQITFQNREFISTNSEETSALSAEMSRFKENEKAQKYQEMVELEETLREINEELSKEGKEAYFAPEWLKMSKLWESWAELTELEEKRLFALELRFLLIALEGEANPLKNWMREKARLFRRTFEEESTEDLAKLGEKIQAFRTVEKPLKQNELEALKEKFSAFENECEKGKEEELEKAGKKEREEIQKMWDEMESGEKRKEHDVTLLIQLNGLKDEFLGSASELVGWIEEKTKELEKKDFDDSLGSLELEGLLSKLNLYFYNLKPPRGEQLQKLEGLLKEIKKRVTSEDTLDFEPPQHLQLDEIIQKWKNLEKIEAEREASLKKRLDLAKLIEGYKLRSSGFIAWLKEETEKEKKKKKDDVFLPKTVKECESLIHSEQEGHKFIQQNQGREKEQLKELYAQILQKGKIPESEEGELPTSHEIGEMWEELMKEELETLSLLAHMLVRLGDQERLNLLKDHEDFWIKIQAIARGNEVRRKLKEKNEYYLENEEKVIQAQTFWRAKAAGKHYLALKKDNPPASTIQRFLHLLDDSFRDFEEELEIEKMKEQAVMQIRDNQEKEKAVNILDIKIALLIKNRTTLDDVIESSRKFLSPSKKKSKDEAEQGLKSLDKDARQKLENYQFLFYLLQTEPRYLAHLIFLLKKNERIQKFLETIILTLYGYAQNDREEYLLLKLFKQAIDYEVREAEEAQDLLRSNPIFVRLVVQYTRGVKEKQFLKELLEPLITRVIEHKDLDLDVDPISIYRSLIREEEEKGGKKSTLSTEVSRSQALENDRVMKLFVTRLRELKALTELFLEALVSSLGSLPFGLRYIAAQIKMALLAKFPGEEEEVTKIIGNLIFYRYLNPALVAPEGFEVLPMGKEITSQQRRCLGEISKVLVQISMGRQFEDELFHLSALNDFLFKAKEKLFKFFLDAATVSSPEEYFKVDEFDDFAKRTKPVIYISQEEIFSTHALLLEHLDDLCPIPTSRDSGVGRSKGKERDQTERPIEAGKEREKEREREQERERKEERDPLRVILEELGAPPQGSDDVIHRGPEMALMLSNKWRSSSRQSEESDARALFVNTKRMVLAILQVHHGNNLTEILAKSVSPNDEKTYAMQQETEDQRNLKNLISGTSKPPSLFDIAGLTFEAVKKKTMENLDELERKGLVSRDNDYQDILNALAKDIKTKNRRRVQRKAELEKLRGTLSNLQTKTNYLQGQILSYQEYVDACVAAMSENRGSKRGKKKAHFPFSAQYFHEQKLKREGKDYRFGSFKYTAERLFEKGVLVDLPGVPPSQFGKVSITLSSDEVGVFEVEGKFMGIKMDAIQLRLDDLLQKQFDHVNCISLFGSAKVNVNLLIFLLNKKFYC